MGWDLQIEDKRAAIIVHFEMVETSGGKRIGAKRIIQNNTE